MNKEIDIQVRPLKFSKEEIAKVTFLNFKTDQQ